MIGSNYNKMLKKLVPNIIKSLNLIQIFETLLYLLNDDTLSYLKGIAFLWGYFTSISLNN